MTGLDGHCFSQRYAQLMLWCLLAINFIRMFVSLQFCLAHSRLQYLTFHTDLPGKIFASNTVFVQYLYNTLINCRFFLKCGYARGMGTFNTAYILPELLYLGGMGGGGRNTLNTEDDM